MEHRCEDGQVVAYEVAGQGLPLLLLHGFPQTRALWRPIAERLGARFTCVMPDLRGYGDSPGPVPAADLSNYSFRAMAGDAASLMAALGFESFAVAGHDRGARVAHRMSLDHPGRVERLAVMDIVPTRHLLDHWTYEVSRDYFHWSFLAQPAPLPEVMIGDDPDAFYQACLLGWGGARISDFPAIEEYRAAWRRPEVIAAMTDDYRAAAGIGREHDAADAGRKVECPALVLWGASGVMARRFDVAAVWAEYLSDMTARAIPGGHFFVDQSPAETAEALAGFFGAS